MLAVSLLSGGLDSILATRVILDQGIEIKALNYVSVFCTCTSKSSSCSAAASAVKQLGVELKTINTSSEFFEIVKNPKHGYGRNLNPCIDCRILMFKNAADYMREIRASFVVTGEVLGERPMSQRREAMRIIEKESGLEGLIVRPLSAALLEPSVPEERGWVDRSKLMAIKGRSRRPQIELAQSFGIKDYPCPAGGCRLTDAGFAARMRDLMEYNPDFSVNDVKLLRIGRHFRLSPVSKAIVGRDEKENEKILALISVEDTTLEAVEFTGPVTLVRGKATDGELRLAAAATARYGKGHGLARVKIAVSKRISPDPCILEVEPANEDVLAELRIGNKIKSHPPT